LHSIFLYILKSDDYFEKINKNKSLNVNYNKEMSRLVNLNSVDDQILDEIFEDDIIVYEDVQGSKIWVNCDSSGFTIKPKSISNEPINLVDLAMQNYYNSAFRYFNTFDSRIKGLMPKNWWFCFEYFPDNQPANIEYNRLPKNCLVLASICKNGKYEFTIDELREYSRLFDVDCLPVIFEGKLSDDMKQAIKYFLNTSESDLEYVFGEKSFAFFFYKILNPYVDGSFLMENDFQKNLQKIIIQTSKNKSNFEILNPLYQRISNENSTEFVEVYTLILVSFLNFCQSLNIEDLKIKGQKRDEAYLYLICKLFNMYVSEVKDDLLNFDFTIPQFFDKEKFKINKELISNKLTNEIITESDKLEYIFKVLLGSLSKKRKKPIGVFTDRTLILFNSFIDKIDRNLDTYLNKLKEIDLTRGGLLDFGDFFDLKFDRDGSGQVYPDVYDTFEKEPNSIEKKKGKFYPK
jgi:hypothetical protein